MGKAKRKNYDGSRRLRRHIALYIGVNMLIWFNMFLTILIMNPRVAFISFEQMVKQSVAIAGIWSVLLLIHIVVYKVRQARHRRMYYKSEQGLVASEDFWHLEESDMDEPQELHDYPQTASQLAGRKS